MNKMRKSLLSTTLCFHALIAIYLRIAFYYQLSTMATLSYSDVWPTNTAETIVLLIGIFAAGGWFAAMAGAMETAVHHADADELRCAANQKIRDAANRIVAPAMIQS
jgi:hypothetical protein